MQLKAYIEMWSQSEEDLSHTDRIEKGRTKLFDFDYPIFDPNFKKDFETHFIRHFYTREIGFETEGLFKFHLETWLQIHMPYFNKLFESELIDYNPLENSQAESTHTTDKTKTQNLNQDGTRNLTGDSTKNTSGNSSTTDDGFNRHLEMDTPDTRLTITSNDGQGVIEYASKVEENNVNNTNSSTASQDETSTNDVNETSSSDTTSDTNETETFTMTRGGKIGVQSYAKMIQEHRQAFMRIEKQIFEEMQQLFMLVY
jgi:hypothetical protein